MLARINSIPIWPSGRRTPLPLGARAVGRVAPLEYNRQTGAWERRGSSTSRGLRGEIEPFILVSWNVDEKAPQSGRRLLLSLEGLEALLAERSVSADRKASPAIICLQEVHRDALQTLYAHEWVRDNFVIIREGHRHDAVTLVSARLSISDAFVVEFPKTAMGGQALFVDVHMRLTEDGGTTLVRVANTHLESLNHVAEWEEQLRLVTTYVQLDGIDFAIICGDRSADSPHHYEYPAEIGLSDVWTFSSRNVGQGARVHGWAGPVVPAWIRGMKEGFGKGAKLAQVIIMPSSLRGIWAGWPFITRTCVQNNVGSDWDPLSCITHLGQTDP